MKLKKLSLIFSLTFAGVLVTSCTRMPADVIGPEEVPNPDQPSDKKEIVEVSYIACVLGSDKYKITYNDGTSSIVDIKREGTKKDSYTINYYLGKNIYKTENVLDGEFNKKPTDPVKGNLEFEGWYTRNSIQWIFNGFQCFSDMSLYAKFKGEELDIPESEKPTPTPTPTPNPDPIPGPDTGSNYRVLNKDNIRFKYLDLANSDGTISYIPSKGKPNILVVPVEFSDLTNVCRFNETNLAKIDATFNGTNPDGTTEYWESVSSFYKKSSYGLLDMNFIVTDPFTPTISSGEFVNLEQNTDGGGTYNLLGQIKKSLKIDGTKVNFDDPKYDIDDNGYVDGIWMIYNDDRESTMKKYWPYVYWYDDVRSKQQISNYGNCSFAFMFEGTKTGHDPHTMIHETGHLLGLDDYYTYDGNWQSATATMDMMDGNIGDHNAFSKFSLGWISPKIATNAGSFTLKPFQTTGDALILANRFNDSAFSEYLILTYYQPTGLNELDAFNQYPSRPFYFQESGLRVFHVDARIAKYNFDSYGQVTKAEFISPSVTRLDDMQALYRVGNSNTRSQSFTPNNDLLAAIPADGRTVYKSRNPLGDSAIFTVGQRFNISKFSKFFVNNLFNEGTAVTFDFKVNSIEKDELKLTINM